MRNQVRGTRGKVLSRRPERRRASALIVAMGVLTVLALLGFTMAAMTRVERTVSRNYVDQVRARLVATSGLECAFAALKQQVYDRSYDAPVLEDGSALDWFYGVDDSGAVIHDYSTPLSSAAEPSLRSNALNIQGLGTVGVSGHLPGTYDAWGDFYSLQIADCASKIYINGPAYGNVLGPNVVRMLNTLGTLEGIANLGTRVSAMRAAVGAGGFAHLMELKDFARFGNDALSEQEFDIASSFITVWMWVDQNTVHPEAFVNRGNESTAPTSANTNASPTVRWRKPAPAIADPIVYRWGQFPDPGYGIYEAIFGNDNPFLRRIFPFCNSQQVQETSAVDHVNTNYGYSEVADPPFPPPVDDWTQGPLQPRAPININTAPRSVLIAAMAGVQGRYIDPANKTWINPGQQKISSALSTAQAGVVADRIIALRQTAPFVSYPQLTNFLINDAQIGSIDEFSRMALAANASPNTHMMSFNPDSAMGTYVGSIDKTRTYVGSIDKTNLSVWTTEFCFGSMGYYDIRSLGRVCRVEAGAYRIVGEAQVSALVKLYDVYRHTSQRNFEYESTQLVDNQVVVTESVGTASFTKTFPESILDISAPNAANYDGHISALPYDFPTNASQEPTLRLDFGTGYRADYSRINRPNAAGTADEGRSLVDATPVSLGIWPTSGQLMSDTQSELFPDGFFSHEARRYPYTYNSAQNSRYGRPGVNPGGMDEYLRYESGVPGAENTIPGTYNSSNGTWAYNYQEDDWHFRWTGSMEMWVKPTWDVGTQTDPASSSGDMEDTRTFFSMGDSTGYRYRGTRYRNYPDPTWYTTGGILSSTEERVVLFARDRTMNLYFGNNYETSAVDRFGSFQKTSLALPVSNVGAFRRWAPGEWHHLAFSWERSGVGHRVELYIDGRKAPNSYTCQQPLRLRGQNSMFFGCSRFRTNLCNSFPLNADSTMDTIRIYGLTTPVEDAPPNRYKPTSTPRFSSTLVTLPAGTPAGAIAQAYWTERVPADGGDVVVNVTAGGTTQQANRPQGSPLSIPAGSAAPQDIRYEVVFTLPSTIPLLQTPILEDFSLIVTRPPRFLQYGFE